MDIPFWLEFIKNAHFCPVPESLRIIGDTIYVIAYQDQKRVLLLTGEDDPAFCGEVLEHDGGYIKYCELTRKNCEALQVRFPYTAPSSLHGKSVSIGLGDRLGIASIAHIKAIMNADVFPVLAQQSKRELELTGRTNRQMMDDVAWQVFEAGYEGGYAADGDHRKTLEEVVDSLNDGVTMITLDCSEHIENAANQMPCEDAWTACTSVFSKEMLAKWRETYCGKTFTLKDGSIVCFGEATFPQMLLMYGNAVSFAKTVFEQAIVPCPHAVSFEVSIDETEVETEPCAHYFVAAELLRQGVRVDSMAPRFCGEFQKGIDYIGNVEEFQKEFKEHVSIANHFGYRISVHSGSDKFSVFPYIGKLSGHQFHLKTSGTTWVESVRVIAQHDPALFRRMVLFSFEHFEAAKKYYHVKADVKDVPDVAVITDENLPALMDEEGTRQVMHITYGFLLQAKDSTGNVLFRNDIYHVLHQNKDVFNQHISKHICRHLQCLGITFE
jgi:hypothetical protein